MADDIKTTEQIVSENNQVVGNVDPNKVQVDVDKIRESKVHICMPCYGGQLTESTFMSMIRWSNTARQLGIDYTVETLTNESLISRARNTLVAKFLSNEESTHLLFVDADIGFEPWHVLLLLHHACNGKDVVGGMYPLKGLPIKWCVNGFEGAEEEDFGRVQEVSKTGTGFMMIGRQVFAKLVEHPATIPFINDIGLDPALNKDMKTFFDTDVREGRYYSEDWTFCENWRDLGGKVWVDKRIMLKHTGHYTYDHVGQDATYRALHEELKDTIPVVIDPDLGKIETESNLPKQQAELAPERRSAKILAKTTGKRNRKKAS